MHFVSQQAREAIIAAIPLLISRSQNLVELKLWNLGITTDEARPILDEILSQDITSLQALNLRQNPEIWTEEENVELLRQVLAAQEQLLSLDLTYSGELCLYAELIGLSQE